MKKAKNISIKHFMPGDFQLDYVLLPTGFSYNKEITGAKNGDVLDFINGESFRIFAVKKIPLTSFIADVLCRMRYGITIKGALSRWRNVAVMEGHSADVISNTECLWVIFEKCQ